MSRKELLEQAIELTMGERNKDYGDVFENHQRIANIFNAVTDGNAMLCASDIALVHIATKLSRMQTSPTKPDNAVDLMAYAGIWFECRMEEEFLSVKKEIEEDGLVGPNGRKR